MSDNTVMTEVTTLLKRWEDEHEDPNHDPIPTLTRLAEVCEVETENYLKMDPDPFDERHPSRTDPDCKLGQILKAVFKKDNFMNKLVNDYLRDNYFPRATSRDVNQLNIAACRLMLDVMPGLETSVVFQPPDMDELVDRLIKWATDSIEPLQSYATGLLAAAMEIPEIAGRFREKNGRLVPLLLQRLYRLQASSDFSAASSNSRPFAHLSSLKSPVQEDSAIRGTGIKRPRENGMKTPVKDGELSDSENEQRRKRARLESEIINTSASPQKSFLFNETSNSSWAELESFVIGTVQIFPPTIVTRQILILRYMTPLAEYQEFISHAFENDVWGLIRCYVNVRATKEARLAFEALKFLAAVLIHKKFALDFIARGGLEALLDVPRPSIAATGVSICLYYLGYCEEAMEVIGCANAATITNLVKYALWLLECSHDSGRCHAIMFFGLTFQFKVILNEFDAQDGLRKLHNVIATLPILLSDADTPQLNEDQECAARQIVRHVCVAYRRYFEAHLYAKVEPLRRPGRQSPPFYKACKSSPEEIEQQVETLQQNMPFKGHWTPVEQLLKLGDITLLLKIIAFSYEWTNSGRAETVRSALDVLAIACLVPKVQLLLCERVDLPEESSPTVGMNIILGAAEGEIVADPEVQKAALKVIINCVCAPINRVNSHYTNYLSQVTNSPNKKASKVKTNEELLQKVWDCVRSNSGIMVLLQLMTTNKPIDDADSIRMLACKALTGLARSETVRQIVSKLPLFTNGELQSLIKNPILQAKRQEHVAFQKYALELLMRLSGKTQYTGNKDLEASLANVHRANIVAQTKIQFNDRELLQLVHQHFVSKGLLHTAEALVTEANLGNSIIACSIAHQPTKFRYSSTLTPPRKLSFSTPSRAALPSPTVQKDEPVLNGSSPFPAIKLIKRNLSQVGTPVQNSRLQKQTNNDVFPRMLNQSSIEEPSTSTEQPKITLDSIIVEYLANQHALCKNPMANCPKFNLFVPHKCPDPKPRITSAANCVVKYGRRALGYQDKSVFKKFIHSRFCPVQTIRSSSPSDGDFFTCAKFLPGDQSIIVGDYSGDVRIFNLHTGNEESTFQAHDNYIVHLEPNRTGELLLTSSTWGRPLSALWSIRGFEMKIPLEDEDYVEFSKVSQNKMIGTKLEVATIYDVATGQEILKLTPSISNQYTKNKATFSPFDDLVLSDGVLFDVNSGKQIHKLDKLNQTQSGVFHPNGLEIVSNTEVWDIRTFHLLKTVPVLNHCTPIFAPINNAIYAYSMEQEMDDGDSTFDSSFKTVDAIDYSSIATIDVKKNIYDLSVNKYDTQIAIVENQGVYQSVQESVVRIYDVGRKRDDEDEQDEEDDDEEDDMDGSDDDGSDNDGANSFIDRLVIDMVGADNGNNDNNDDNDENDDDYSNSLSGSESDSWTSLSSDDSVGDFDL